MGTIRVKDLSVRGIIGVNDWEREKKQEIVVNAELRTDMSRIIETDDLSDGVNYRSVTKDIIRHIRNTERYTLEALTGDILDLCLEYDGVQHAKVSVEKPGALRFSKSVAVVLEGGETDSS